MLKGKNYVNIKKYLKKHVWDGKLLSNTAQILKLHILCNHEQKNFLCDVCCYL